MTIPFAPILALFLTGCFATPAAASPLPAPPMSVAAKIKIEIVTRDTVEPVGIVAAPGEPVGRMFVVEKRGLVRVLRGAKFDATPFLDFTRRVALESRANGEQGLLGLVFHPGFAENRRLFVNFTDVKGDTRVLELRADAAGARVEPKTEREVLHVKQPWANHNAGDLAFGRDGKLYVALGDGGSANDPRGHAQNPKEKLGKLLRIDVDRPGDPVIEVIGKGLRNPWRYSFDRKTGDLYLADVGQNLWEYIHVAPANKLEGHNFGWNIVEGLHCFGKATCETAGLTRPVVEFSHKEGCSITGGYVYRGKLLPEIDGHYFYSDYCSALLRSFRLRDGKAVDQWDWKAALDPDGALAQVASFGEDQAGELYIVTHDGGIHRFARR